MAVGEPYLDVTEYEAFGLDTTTPSKFVADACRLVDELTNRSEPDPLTGVVNGLWEALYINIKRLKEDRNVVRLPQQPANELVSLQGRYKRNRRSDEPLPCSDIMILEGSYSTNGIPKWIDIPVDDAQLDVETGRLWVPLTLTGLKFSEVRVQYRAGFRVIPSPVKQAVALIVREMPDPETFQRNTSRVRGVQEGDMRLDFFEPGLVPKEAHDLLRPYRLSSLV